MNGNQITVKLPSAAMLPDNTQYTNRFEVPSSSSNHIYIVSQHKTGRWWACSCHGWIRHKHCKHLTSLGLPGNHQPYEVKLLPPGAPAVPAAPKFQVNDRLVPEYTAMGFKKIREKLEHDHDCPNPACTNARLGRFGARVTSKGVMAYVLSDSEMADPSADDEATLVQVLVCPHCSHQWEEAE